VLDSMGISAQATGRNDISIDGLKISGTAEQIAGNNHKRLLHHGTLLFDPDLNMLEGALNADPDKYIGKGVKSVKKRVGRIKDYIGNQGEVKKNDVTLDIMPDTTSDITSDTTHYTTPSGIPDTTIRQFWKQIKNEFAKGTFIEETISEAEKLAIQKLKKEKYDTWEWNYGYSPEYDFINKKRFKGGSLEIQLSVNKGIIKNIKIYGDFLPLYPIDELINLLLGKPYIKETIEKTVSDNIIRDCLGSISKKEFLDTLFE